MKKLSKLTITLLLALVLTVNLAQQVEAAGKVTYVGKSHEFIFEPGSDLSPTDLFEDLKDVMPGDSITQQVVIKNKASKSASVRVYMRSLGAQEETNEFLSQMKLTVEQEGESTLFEAPADETAQLTDWVCLGRYYHGAEITLNVTLEVPITMGNEFQEQVGYVDWEFKIEEIPFEEDVPDEPEEPPVIPSTPATGDNSHFGLYIVLVLICGVVLWILKSKLFKTKKEE